MHFEGQAVAQAGDVDRFDAEELAALADELVDQIATARRHYADLRAAIDDAADVVATAPPEVDDREDDDTVEHDDDLEGGYHRTPEEEAEIVALGMALNGGNREDAHVHIVETFGIYETDEILDRTFGPTVQRPHREGRKRRRFGRRG